MQISLIISIIFSGLFASNEVNQTKHQVSNTPIVVLAEQISPGEGSKIHIAEYKVLKTIQGKPSYKIFKVGYYGYKVLKPLPKYAILTLEKYQGKTDLKGYYIFPDYDPNKGLEKVKVSTISVREWEACEKGLTDCKAVEISRKSYNEKLYLMVPCGGTSTSVTLSTKPGINHPSLQHIRGNSNYCEPVFDLTHLKDGKYFAYMLACFLGGPMEINLKTEK